MGYQYLKIAEEVTGETQVMDAITPDSGKKITVIQFIASAYPSQNSAIRLVWKMAHATETEEEVWTVKGNGTMPIDQEDPGHIITDADGVRKLGICCDNGEVGAMYMSGWAKVLVE
jgi:hypothetical protein